MSFNKNVDAGSASLASVAMGSNGEVYVVIQQVDSTTGQNNINFNHCAPNRGWGAATLVDNLSGDADYPKIAVNGVIMPSVSGVRSMVVQPIFMPAIVPQVAGGSWEAQETIEAIDGFVDAESGYCHE